MIGRVLNQRYELIERSGDGAFFQVFKARDRAMNRVVAVKIPHEPFAADADFRAGLRSGASSATLLTHANIARLFEVGTEEDGVPFLVEEFVRGVNLKERIKRIAPFTLSVAVDFAIAAGEGIQHAHAAGTVHGDLRSHNVMVSPEGAVKITDFGVSPVLGASPQAAASNLGRAAHYQAPELASGFASSPASDIYSLGAILFEMVTGSPPYPGDSPVTVAMKHRNDPIPSPRALNAGVPRALEGVVMKALQKDPRERYSCVGDMLSDLRNVRDALRFGKPLSWSPLQEEGQGAEAPPAEPQAPPPASAKPQFEQQGGIRMATAAARDDRIPGWIRFLLFAAFIVAFGAALFGAALWMTTFTKPPEARLPNLVGEKLERAQRMAETLKVRLIVHEEFNDKVDEGVIYRSGWDPNRTIQAGRSVNIWVSRGSRMVWVPGLSGLTAEAAEGKIKEAGLRLGRVDRKFDDKAAYNTVIGQNPRAGKRLERDTEVHLVVSDGKEEAESVPGTGEEPPNGTGGEPSAGEDIRDLTEPRYFTIRIQIRRDGRGDRQVRVEYDDEVGTHTPIDEVHPEGAEVRERVEVFGRRITVRVYYNDDASPVSEQSIELPRRRR